MRKSEPGSVSRHTRVGERLIGALLFGSEALSILATVGIVVVLLTESLGFFAEVSPVEFLAGTRWSPDLVPRSFGILPLVNGTLLVAAGAALIALPTGLATAIYLSEFASLRTKRTVKPALEILAGIPTVVYGYFAVTLVTPVLRTLFPGVGVFNAASAAIVVGIMILPMVSSLSEDALSAVPDSLREAAYGVGATRFEVATRIVVPAGLPGIAASFILAISRAIAETIVVTLAAGATPGMTLDLLQSVQTMTAYIVQVSLGDAPSGSIEYRTLFAVGLLLFLITLALNLLSQRMTTRFRESFR
ncbi:MAG: phosphate ABC transporter permease subunit PstC [Gemmatimonadales bacterium]|nr:phosphate ABC transporter permease subunit PstC [Gemmatimonadales bacterium]MYE35495.1 phosphate ABC transporter permease subunit PstC [Gemmatimonadales bacterium]MYG49567.1 phosphate ABC transporter permease subunit PstC [Gemmatimonadales bacterium]MYK00965.1 phosphate ABC transporter permease subunit PstC [Candidatus Palauibacter ramosifaciens]